MLLKPYNCQDFTEKPSLRPQSRFLTEKYYLRSKNNAKQLFSLILRFKEIMFISFCIKFTSYLMPLGTQQQSNKKLNKIRKNPKSVPSSCSVWSALFGIFYFRKFSNSKILFSVVFLVFTLFSLSFLSVHIKMGKNKQIYCYCWKFLEYFRVHNFYSLVGFSVCFFFGLMARRGASDCCN